MPATFPRLSESAISNAIRAPKTNPSSKEFDAKRFAPWAPVHAVSPQA
jgi:hypothetical protein